MSVSTERLSIPFHRAAVGEDEARAIADVVRSGWLTMGPKTLEFERSFAEYVGARHAVAVSSGTAALHLALEAIGIKEGDEVLIPTTTFTATGEVVTYFGAKPVLVDVDPITLNIDPNDAAFRVTNRTRAIIPVHFAGQPCDMDELDSLAKKYNLRIVEDAAHALPSAYKTRRIGTFSDATAFSFYATKTLTTGEGGMVTTQDEGIASRMRLMRLHGIAGDAWKRYGASGSWYYEVVDAGYKYNLTDLQAALGLVQLSKCDELLRLRSGIAKRYNDAFAACESLELPTVHSDRETSWHIYLLRIRLEHLDIDRSEFIRQLRLRGIGASVHFIPLHLHPFYQREYGYVEGNFPRAEAEFRRSISLPIYPMMAEEDVELVSSAVLDIVSMGTRR